MSIGDRRGVSFVVAGTLYAIPFRWVSELVEEPEFVPVREKGMALGLARVRDRWVPVIALGESPAPAEREVRGRAVIVVSDGRSGRLGIWADEVRGWVERAPGGPGSAEAEDDVSATDEGIVTWIDPVRLVGGRGDLLRGGEVMESGTVRTPMAHILEFQLAEEEFAINVSNVFEVIRYPEVRALPQMPPFLEGAAELRGSVLPVVDLRKRFGLDPRPPSPETRVVVADLEGERVGLVVDRVRGVVRLRTDELKPPPKFFKGLAARYMEAVVNREGRNVVVLNSDEILTSKEKIQLRGAGRAATSTRASEGEPP